MKSSKGDAGRTLQDILKEVNDSVTDFQETPARGANDVGSSGDRPLHKVAIWGDIEAASTLVRSGADVNAQGEDLDTPLHRAIAGGSVEMVRWLLQNGADPKLPNALGRTAEMKVEMGTDVAMVAALQNWRQTQH